MQKSYFKNMQIWFQTALFLILSSASALASANWIEAQGSAEIRNGNISQAREEAIAQAVRYASLQSGVQFSSTMETSNGALTKNSVQLLNQTQTGPVELISESINGTELIVKLRIEIYQGPEQACKSDHVKAAILIPQAGLADRTQLRYGQLNEFEQDISNHLIARLNQASTKSFSRAHADTKLDINRDLDVVRGYRLPSWLSETTESQYILVPEILDISVDPPETSMLGLFSDDPNRQFKLRLSLYHGISGEQIWFKQYHTQAPWQFGRQEVVATNGDRFWRSSYGSAIKTIMKTAVADIDAALSCRPVLGQIVARSHDRVILNLGRRHGIRVGDKFSVVLQQNIADRFNQMRVIGEKSDASLVIDQVSEDSATAVLMNKNATYNVQISDIAIKI